MKSMGTPMMFMTNDEREIATKRLMMLKAYADKRIIVIPKYNATKQAAVEKQRIMPLSPIKRPKEKKFNHAKGCSIAANGQVPPRIANRWWEQTPSQAGEKCNVIQRKLSSDQFFTGTQKYKRQSEEHIGELTDADGIDPHRAARLLSHVSVNSLTAHRSSGDIHSEVLFRVQLRNNE